MSFFFLVLRRAPPSTLFPYTTLFRSVLVPGATGRAANPPISAPPAHHPAGSRPCQRRRSHLCRPPNRSEEHTSELQSLRQLVCRLLLEKKKQEAIRVECAARTQSSRS